MAVACNVLVRSGGVTSQLQIKLRLVPTPKTGGLNVESASLQTLQSPRRPSCSTSPMGRQTEAHVQYIIPTVFGQFANNTAIKAIAQPQRAAMSSQQSVFRGTVVVWTCLAATIPRWARIDRHARLAVAPSLLAALVAPTI